MCTGTGKSPVPFALGCLACYVAVLLNPTFKINGKQFGVLHNTAFSGEPF